MKKAVNIFLIFLMIASCNNSKKVSENEQKPVFKFQETPCFGQCPVYKMEIFKNGLVKYEGERFVEKLGTYEKTISEEKVERLIKEFDAASFFEFEDEYTSNMTDLPTVYTTYNKGDQSKRVLNYYGAPDELKVLEKKLRKIAESTDGWKKVE